MLTLEQASRRKAERDYLMPEPILDRLFAEIKADPRLAFLSNSWNAEFQPGTEAGANYLYRYIKEVIVDWVTRNLSPTHICRLLVEMESPKSVSVFDPCVLPSQSERTENV